jgi:hypothetical protein
MSKKRITQIYMDEKDWEEFRKEYPRPMASGMVRRLIKKHLEELKEDKN